MNTNFLRSIFSIPLGWIVSCVSTMLILFVIAIFNADVFQPDIQFSVGWLVIMLLVPTVPAVIGGFVTAFIAQRNELKHTIGLAIFSIIIAIYFLYMSTKPMPHWYRITGIILIVPEVLLGGWLRMKQRILLNQQQKGTSQ